MASAAAEKKWPRESQCWAFSASTSRMYASWTKAVALERLPRLLLGYPLGSQAAQFVVDQRQELFGSLAVALLDGGENSGDLVHRMYPALWG